MFPQISIKVESVSVWADFHLTFTISWKSQNGILYFLLSHCAFLTSSNGTRRWSDRLTLKELRTSINLFLAAVTPLFSKSHGKVEHLPKDQSWRLTGLLRVPTSEVIKYPASYLAAWIVCMFAKLSIKPLGMYLVQVSLLKIILFMSKPALQCLLFIES